MQFFNVKSGVTYGIHWAQIKTTGFCIVKYYVHSFDTSFGLQKAHLQARQ